MGAKLAVHYGWVRGVAIKVTLNNHELIDLEEDRQHFPLSVLHCPCDAACATVQKDEPSCISLSSYMCYPSPTPPGSCRTTGESWPVKGNKSKSNHMKTIDMVV